MATYGNMPNRSYMTDLVSGGAGVDKADRKTPTGQRQSEVWAEWEEYAYRQLVDGMRRHKVSYKELSRRLEAFGINESADRLNRKVNRRRFSAAFYLVCCEAIGKSSDSKADDLA